MVREFQAVLDDLPCRPRAQLEGYRELICEMRRRGLTYREIAGVLSDKFQVTADLAVIHDTLRRPRKRSTPVPRRLPEREVAPLAPQYRRERLRIRKEVEGPVFEYDENEPLRLTGSSASME